MTEYIAESLGTALLQLMKDKPLSKISADELTGRAGIGRASYFRNFNSKEEILSAYIEMKWRKYESSLDLKSYNIGSRYRVLNYLKFCYSMKDTNDIIISSGHESSIFNAYEDIITSNGTDISYELSFLTYGLYGVFLHWAKTGYKETPENMTDILINRLFSEALTSIT